jgi:hypothetical protein
LHLHLLQMSECGLVLLLVELDGLTIFVVDRLSRLASHLLLVLNDKRVQLVLVNLKHLTIFIVIVLIHHLAILIKLRCIIFFLQSFWDLHLLFVLIIILILRLDLDLLLHTFDAHVLIIILLLIIVILVKLWLIIGILHLLVAIFFNYVVFLLHLVVHHLLLITLVFFFFLFSFFALVVSFLSFSLLHLISKRKRVRRREVGSRKVESVVVLS